MSVIKFMKGKVNVKFMNVKSWTCEEGIYFVGVIKFMKRESECEIYECEKLELWGGDLFCGCYQIYGPAFGGSLIPGFGH